MIDHSAALLAVRAKALTLSVVSTTDSISATTTGYVRASGSWLTDGYAVGQQVTASGFTASGNNGDKVVTAVSATTLTVLGVDVAADGARTIAAAADTEVESAGSRTISVGLPTYAELTNSKIVPGPGVPWWREEYLPQPGTRTGIGANAMVEYPITYRITLFVPQDTGPLAALSYVDALETLFAPGTALTLAASSFRVRGDSTPFPGQLVPGVDTASGFLVASFTVPLLLRTANTI